MRLTLSAAALCCLAAAGSHAQTTIAEISDPARNEVELVGFRLARPAEVTIEALGIQGNGTRRLVAYPWIINSDTREVVWEMRRGRNSPDHDDNRFRSDHTVEFLPAGSYELYYSCAAVDNDWGDGFDVGDFIYGALRQMGGSHKRITNGDLADCFVRLSSSELSSGDVATFEPDGGLEDALIKQVRVGNNKVIKTSFELTSPQTIDIRAIIEFPESYENPVDNAWIVDTKTRERVWIIETWGISYAGGGQKNKLYRDDVRLEAGVYTLVVVTDDSHSFEQFNVNPPYDALNYGVVLLPGRGFDRNAFRLVDEPVSAGQAALAIVEVGDDEFREEHFALSTVSQVRVYGFGEMAYGEEFADLGWILDQKTGDVVWEMTYFNTEHGGGATKNRVADEVITLPAGAYVLCYQTDGSHSWGDWNASQPYDPDAYGISLFVADPGVLTRQTAAEALKDSHILVSITRAGDDSEHREPFTLDTDATVRIYAIGEGEAGKMYDFAQIVDIESGRRVWRMRYEDTSHAGGARKNRRTTDEVALKAGRYELVYQTDGSHSYRAWNDDPPRDQANWGVTVSLAN